MAVTSRGARLATALTVAALAAVSFAVSEFPGTSALFTTTVSTQATGFVVETGCTADDGDYVPGRIASLGPELQWDMAVAPSGATTAGSLDFGTASTLHCDDEALDLDDDGSLTTEVTLTSSYTLLAAVSPTTSGGQLLTVADVVDDAVVQGLGVVVNGSSARLVTWTGTDPSDFDTVPGSTVSLGTPIGGVHLVAVVVQSGQARLWVNGTSETVTGIDTPSGEGVFAVGMPPDGDVAGFAAQPSAAALVAEVAFFDGALATGDLDFVFEGLRTW